MRKPTNVAPQRLPTYRQFPTAAPTDHINNPTPQPFGGQAAPRSITATPRRCLDGTRSSIHYLLSARSWLDASSETDPVSECRSANKYRVPARRNESHSSPKCRREVRKIARRACRSHAVGCIVVLRPQPPKTQDQSSLRSRRASYRTRDGGRSVRASRALPTPAGVSDLSLDLVPLEIVKAQTLPAHASQQRAHHLAVETVSRFNFAQGLRWCCFV